MTPRLRVLEYIPRDFLPVGLYQSLCMLKLDYLVLIPNWVPRFPSFLPLRFVRSAQG